jgi:ribose/xylose/arabinose/galactoside ABC-type transport system permease subunit
VSHIDVRNGAPIASDLRAVLPRATLPILDYTSRYGIAIALVALIVVGAALSPVFLTADNLLNVARNVALVGIVATAMTFVVISGSFVDLSVPAIILAAAIVTMFVQPSVGLLGSVMIGLAASAALGLINGYLIGQWRANSIVITIAVSVAVLGIAQALVGGAIIYSQDDAFKSIARGNTFGLPTVALILVVVAGVSHLMLRRTVYGRWAYATGGNYPAADASGVPTRRVVMGAFVLSALGAGGAGILLGSLIGHARVGIGDGYEFDAIAAIAIGGTSLLGGMGGIPRTILGVFFIGILNNQMILFGVPNEAQGMLKGGLIVAAVGLDVLLRRMRQQ